MLAARRKRFGVQTIRQESPRRSARLVAVIPGSWHHEHLPVKAFFPTLGVVLIAIGVIWFLQGINVLPGSFMTGQTRWAIIGAISFAVGIGSLIVGKSMR